MAHRLPFAPLLEQNDCHFAQSKGFPSRRPVSTRGDDFMQHPLERGTYQLGQPSHALALIGRRMTAFLESCRGYRGLACPLVVAPEAAGRLATDCCRASSLLVNVVSCSESFLVSVCCATS